MVVKNLSLNELLHRWMMSLANHLVYEENVARSKALRLSHMTSWVLQDLGKGEVHFVYRKEDGTVRDARGTLCRGVCPEYDEVLEKYQANNVSFSQKVRDNSNTEGIYTYWDIDAKWFRSFKAKNLLVIVETIQVNY